MFKEFTMKGSLLFCVLLMVTLSTTIFVEHDVLRSEWQVYKLKHNKTYEVYGEDRYRFTVFLENRRIISGHNAMYYQGQTSYLMGLNAFSDLSPNEFMNMFKSSILVNTSSLPEFKFETISNFKNCQSFDWRSRGAVTPVKHQGNCGSCWAFSTVGVLEAYYFLRTRRLIPYSEQNLLDCNTQNNGCRGGLMPTAFDYVKHRGIHFAYEYPYEGVQRHCRDHGGNKLYIQRYAVLPRNENTLKQVVQTIGPVSVAVDYSGFHHYRSGVFDYPYCSQQTNHAVLVVGFGNQGGRDYWLVKNSWGPQWGEGGYIKMARNRNNQCGITNMATIAY